MTLRLGTQYVSDMRHVVLLALSASFASLVGATQADVATDILQGKQLYSTWCAGCHGADPRQSQPRLAANKPQVLADAIRLVSEMSFLSTVLTSVDVADIASYIGSVADTGVPVLNPTPASIEFGDETTDVPSAERTLLLTNLGSATLTITAIEATPDDYTFSGSCVGTRKPNSTCALLIRFTPSAAGPIPGALSVAIAELPTAMSISLTGAGRLAEGTPAPIVVEYYAPALDHYFVTADLAEQAFVDAGGAGQWLRTGNAFRGGGDTAVCRFYGNVATNPATGEPFGPNSHFYTADAGECTALQSLFDPDAPSWRFESLDFSTGTVVGGSCAAGKAPVYRAYNDGSARGIASNHRITTNRTAIDQVVARGWIDEGPVMCAPR